MLFVLFCRLNAFPLPVGPTPAIAYIEFYNNVTQKYCNISKLLTVIGLKPGKTSTASLGCGNIVLSNSHIVTGLTGHLSAFR